jgi:hypothetical protein
LSSRRAKESSRTGLPFLGELKHVTNVASWALCRAGKALRSTVKSSQTRLASTRHWFRLEVALRAFLLLRVSYSFAIVALLTR